MAKRDEFSCPCCGTPTDSSYCDACEAFECGEQSVHDANAHCLVPPGIEVKRARHAAHYAPGATPRGHDLLIVELTGPGPMRPVELPASFDYHSGSRFDGVQKWRYVRTAPFSEGTCERCRR